MKRFSETRQDFSRYAVSFRRLRTYPRLQMIKRTVWPLKHAVTKLHMPSFPSSFKSHEINR